MKRHSVNSVAAGLRESWALQRAPGDLLGQIRTRAQVRQRASSLVFAAMLLLILGGLVVARRGVPSQRVAESPPVAVTPVWVHEELGVPLGAALQSVPTGVVTLNRGQGVRLAVLNSAQLRLDGATTELLEGTIELWVEKRKSPLDSPVRVKVSHGVIEVLGTHFTVYQTKSGGHVDLHEGHIAFVSRDGARKELFAGGSLTWPERLAEGPALSAGIPRGPKRKRVAPAEPVAVKLSRLAPESVAKEATIEEVLQRTSTLRQAGRIDEALREMEHALQESTRWSQATRERLSFELGWSMSHQTRNYVRACAHWQAHQKQFPDSLYVLEVEAERSVACDLDGRDEPLP